MSKSKFYNEIKCAAIEREVEDVYNKGLALYFDNTTITHPFACDGLIDTKEQGKLLKLITEYKYDKDLKNAVSRACVIVQVLYYIKKFEQNGLVLPNICLVGDINECFVFHTNDIQKYLSYDLDWSIAPSNAHVYNSDLVLEIASDEVINPFVFSIDENFSFKDVADKIKDLAVNVQRLVNVTEHNIAVIYEYFCNNVVKDAKGVQPNDLVSLFINAITDHDACFLHPKKANVLVCNGREYAIYPNAYSSFFSYFSKNYTPQEKSNFSKISDRLIEDTNRRNKGEFYTPTTFVDKAHRMIEKALGEDWKERYVVWDNCCGTKNLTRDYRFAELYCSTLEQGELDQCTDYNKEAVSFQFDFLNDSLDKLPKGLLDALKADKPIVFFLNPPYARAGKSENGGLMGTAKGTAETMVNTQMKADKIGACSANLYAQFLYRIFQIKKQFNLTDCHIALFSPTQFLTGTSWEGFRNVYLNEFAFDNAIQFKASHFADCADTWGISFSIWHNGITENKNDFEYTLTDNIKGEIVEQGKKIVYNNDGVKIASEWVKPVGKYDKSAEVHCFKSGINISNKTIKASKNTIGWFTNGNNNVNHSKQDVFLMCSPNSIGKTNVPVFPENFDRCTALFAARRIVKADWVNWADEYLAPNTEHAAYNEFVNDSLIYSLFESKSNQTSLTGVKNEFFWRSAAEMAEKANACGNDEMYNDARVSGDRYVYNRLQGIELSAEAKAVLDKANEILDATLERRQVFDAEHPEYQVNNWDCGWYQIKAMATKEELKEFKALFDRLADKMRPMVYKLGFLK